MLTSLSLVLAMASGQAAEPAPSPEPHHQVFVAEGGPTRDADGDGFVSRDEFTSPLAEAFARLDKDGDGRLSQEERQAAQGEMRVRRPGRPMAWRHARARHGDAGTHAFIVERAGDGDARIMIDGRPPEGGTRFEILTPEGGTSRNGVPMILRRHGEQGDGERRTVIVERDGDGPPKVIVNGREVDGAEADAAMRRMEGGLDGPRVFMRRPGPGGHAMLLGGRDGERGEVFVHRIDSSGDGGLDKDGDGKVSEEEFLAPMREAFREMDADRSGALEDGERGAAHD